MTSKHSGSALIGVIFGLLCASEAGAQTPASSLEALKIFGSTNSQVTVTDTTGREFRGTVADASDAQLSLRIAGAVQRFVAADVRSVRVRREDGLANGAVIGAAVGAGLTSLLFLDNECRDDPACFIGVAVYGGMGALMGIGIDALIHRSIVVYTAPARSTGPTVAVAPFSLRGRSGVRLTIGW